VICMPYNYTNYIQLCLLHSAVLSVASIYNIIIKVIPFSNCNLLKRKKLIPVLLIHERSLCSFLHLSIVIFRMR
jgi:hypothetical protein